MRRLNWFIVLVSALFVLGACGDAPGESPESGDSTLGADDSDDSDGEDDSDSDDSADEDEDDDSKSSAQTNEDYDPCEELSCGEQCTVCPPDDDDCAETMEIKVCNADGECISDTNDPALCEDYGDDDEYDPCDGLTCGDECSLCAPDDDDCAETMEIKVCNADGKCVSDTNDPELCKGDDDNDANDYDPCEGLTCGDQCTLCPPDDDDCAETTVMKYCDSAGECSAQQPACTL